MKKVKKIAALLMATIMCSGIITGCSSNSSSSSASTSAGTKETSGKILRYQVKTLVDSLDPALLNDSTSCGVISQCMMGLYTKDENGTPVFGMAKSVEKSDDGLVYTYTIRDDAYWTNGDPVTANDFVFAWRRIADPDVASPYQFFIQTAGLKNVDAIVAGEMDPSELGVEATDDKTLVVTLEQPCPILENLLLASNFLPIEESFFEKCGSSYATSPETINCNGPFKISSYEPSTTTISEVKNDKYYDADSVKLDGIEFKVITDSQTAAMSYDSGDLDVVTLSGSLVEQYSDDPAYSTRSDGYSWYLCPNESKAGLDNLNIRKALAKSFDKTVITDSILKDGSSPMDYFIPVGLASSSSGSDFRDDAGNGYSSWKYDMDEALELWNKGLEEIEKTSLSFTLMCDDTDEIQSIAQFLQNEWQTNLPGLTIDLQVVPKKARLANMKSGDYDIGLTRWGPDYADPMSDLDLWVSDGTANYSRYSNPEYDAAITSAKTGEAALDLDERWELLVSCEKMLADDCALFPVYGQSVATMTNPSVSGIQYYSVGIPYLFINVDKN